RSRSLRRPLWLSSCRSHCDVSLGICPIPGNSWWGSTFTRTRRISSAARISQNEMTKVRERSTAEDAEISELKQRLEEAEETLRAIREGEVDALVVDGPRGEVIYTMTSADYPYRLMIDEMNEGAVSVSPDAFILYSNRNFASIL